MFLLGPTPLLSVRSAGTEPCAGRDRGGQTHRFSLSLVRSQASDKEAMDDELARSVPAYRIFFDILSMALGNVQVRYSVTKWERPL